jgi:hypothetical protein
MVVFTRGEPPTRPSEESQSSHRGHASDLTPTRARDTQSPCSVDHLFDRHRSQARGKPRGASMAAREDRNRSGAGKVAAFPRASPPDAPAARQTRRHRRTSSATSQPVVTPSCGQRDKRTHQGATHGSARRRGVRCLTAGIEDTFPRFGTFRRNQMCRSLSALDCLPSAFRSQGFSPSQRFDPGTPSWLYFKPHPPVGFMGLQSFSHRGQPSCLSAFLLLSCHRVLLDAPANRRARGTSTHPSGKPDRQWRRTNGDPGSRALLRPGVRHSTRRVNVTSSRCSPGLFPLRGVPTRPLGLTPPLVHLSACHLRRGARRRCFRVSIRSSLGAAPEGVASASMRFVTSYEPCRCGLRRVTPDRLGNQRAASPASRTRNTPISPVSLRFRC